MKKFLVMGAAVALAMGFSACQNEDLALSKGGETTVTFAINMPKELSSRAVDASTLPGRGDRAQYLYYAIYKSGTKDLIKTNETSYDGEVRDNKTYEFDTNLTTTVEVNLVVGKSYDFVFWAAAGDGAAEVYDFNPADQTVTVNYGRADGFYNNAEGYDAFFKGETLTITEGMNETIMLKRPFAQLNIGTDDLNETHIGGINIDALQTSVKVPVYSKFNAFSGDLVGEATTQEFKMLPISAIKQKDDSKYNFPVEHATEGKAYEYISLSYLLVDDRDLVDVEFNLTDGATDLNRKYNQVPVQRNYRTNIYGSLLTTNALFTIEINPIFENPDYNVYIATEAELVAALKEGGDYTLIDDIEVDQAVTVLKNDVSIDLNGRTISLSNNAMLYPAYQADVEFSNGTIVTESGNPTYMPFCPQNEGTVMRFVNMNVNTENRYYAFQIMDSATVEIINSTFTCGETIFTCNANVSSGGYGGSPVIKISDSTLTATESAVIMNVPGTVEIKDSEINGRWHAVMMRGGTATITDSVLKSDWTSVSSGDVTTATKRLNGTTGWGGLNSAPFATLLMGNKGTGAYQYPTKVTLVNTSVSITGTDSTFPAVYAYANTGDGLGVTFDYDSDCTFSGALVYGNDGNNIVVNGSSAE